MVKTKTKQLSAYESSKLTPWFCILILSKQRQKVVIDLVYVLKNLCDYCIIYSMNERMSDCLNLIILTG